MSNLYDLFSNQKKENNTEQWKEEQKANREYCYQTIEKTLSEVAGSTDNLARYLDVQSRFDQYSVRNALLVAEQRPEAIKLGDYKYWREQGVYIQKKEIDHHVLILGPGNEYQGDDGKMHQGFRPKKMYDVTQTTMRQRQETKISIEDRTLLGALIHEAPVKIKPVETLKKGVLASYVPEEQAIYIVQGLQSDVMFQVLARELSKEQLMTDGVPKVEAEVLAPCASYMICKRYQVPVGEISLDGAVKELTKMENAEKGSVLSQIRDSTGELLSRMQRSLELSKNTREQGQER